MEKNYRFFISLDTYGETKMKKNQPFIDEISAVKSNHETFLSKLNCIGCEREKRQKRNK